MPPTMFPPGLRVGTPNALLQGQGRVTCTQTVTLAQNGTNAVTATVVIPPGSVQDVTVDTLTAWNSATSATLTVGFAAAGSDIAGGISTTAAGRLRPTYTGPQLAALPRSAETVLFITITPVGATSAGLTRVTIEYDTE